MTWLSLGSRARSLAKVFTGRQWFSQAWCVSTHFASTGAAGAVTSINPSADGVVPRRRKRGALKRKKARCPLHPEERVLRCSVKRYQARSMTGDLLAAPPGRQQSEAWAAGLGFTVLLDRWLETVLCCVCGEPRTWQVTASGASTLQLSEVPESVRRQLGPGAVLIPSTNRACLRLHRPDLP